MSKPTIHVNGVDNLDVFLHNQLTKTWALLSSTSRIELTVIPFGKARCVAKGDDFECTCQHGAIECSLNQLMNCVIDRLPNPDKYLPVIDCIQGRGDLNEAMTSCMNSSALPDSKEIYACATGPSGRRLLAEAGEKTKMLKPPLDSVPWVVIDGDPSSDAAGDLTNVLCRKLTPSPEACTEVLQGRNA
ncbi:unnamed protein product [Nippostrongylus brasiliensis]|uniref:GILT-like protein (inferred by orthology to a C. elegans protein) n=1 Tax=Nippostrongylus brasiliensis TaxID=27835 RepID=A0A0N4XWV8_NIPBR|nr:unnamed protein product [Nippostrongylus brasiliensis]